mmetsp:Transcript_363/g.809  ORF Transcript_363/g.809 Transcript_363/m.809 type:complete len:641 (+) Transcript_363:166-2088(+)|eukprot:CAMPEP_0206444428 /NCGR_PEP_ID=MMETSP0324_2-20121206/14905_1 /ASSEMBLY_ACC=CAM_ASM_000836 /TAXON_ID=2866 /ORGANISM="Crypthecodinium cohnii, Strain Seligo" /LENGTH=640 /DNA_ID=CAMNT_0053912447 /DNA_START=147 /DNA_END=2069 /DNA_ORIENTATION=+
MEEAPACAVNSAPSAQLSRNSLIADDEVHRFNFRTFLPERVNQQIAQRYDIDPREIGSGGHGKVFFGEDKVMKGRRVAIKKIICLDQEKKEAFQNEVLIMKELDHPSICKIFGTYDEGRWMFQVMEFLEGGELYDRIMEEGNLEEPVAMDILRQVASALHHAHSRGIAHRDMKAENICFCTRDPEDNQVKVIDWGLGFYFGQARMKSSVGSLTYAAPEVLEAEDNDVYTSACDLWSLGVLAYVVLSGLPPFEGSYMQQVRNMRKEKYDMTKSVWSTVSPEAKDLIASLLRFEPKERMTLDRVLQHKWLSPTDRVWHLDEEIGREVLTNLRSFSTGSSFFSFCVALMAKQLDHRSLRHVHRVFCEMDTNGDGVLELKELREGFVHVFGEGSETTEAVEEIFHRLDLDGSGTIDYTEFCAAGIGERLSNEEHILWAAFKAFDTQDEEDNRITKNELKTALMKADANRFLTEDLCEEFCDEILARFDGDGDGSLDFEEWLRLMRDIAKRQQDEDGCPVGQRRPCEEQPNIRERTTSDRLMEELEFVRRPEERLEKAYNVLREVNSLPASRQQSKASMDDERLSLRSMGTGGGAGGSIARRSPQIGSRRTSLKRQPKPTKAQTVPPPSPGCFDFSRCSGRCSQM